VVTCSAKARSNVVVSGLTADPCPDATTRAGAVALFGNLRRTQHPLRDRAGIFPVGPPKRWGVNYRRSGLAMNQSEGGENFAEDRSRAPTAGANWDDCSSQNRDLPLGAAGKTSKVFLVFACPCRSLVSNHLMF